MEISKILEIDKPTSLVLLKNGKEKVLLTTELKDTLNEAINYTRSCMEFETDKEKDAFDKGYSKGWDDGISVQ